MDQRGDEVHTSSTDATGASKEGVVRWMLVIGLLLAIVLLSIIWITGALSQSDDSKYQSVGDEIGAQKTAGATQGGEPVMPAPETSSSAQSTTHSVTHPDAQSTPGDAPAGDPRPDAQ